LTQVVSPTATVDFSYTGDGVRVGKTVDGNVTAYVQDLGAPLPVVLVETANGQDMRYLCGLDLLAQTRPDATRRWYHADALGSTRVLTEVGGTAVAGYDYDAFGAVRGQTDGGDNPFSFTGEQLDTELGLVYLRARYYDPEIGRFTSRDQFIALWTKTSALNPYSYAANGPTVGSDPGGLLTWPQSYGAYAEASGKLGPIGLSLALDIDVPAAEFRLSLNFVGGLRPDQVGKLITRGSGSNPDLKPTGKIVAGIYSGNAGETSLGFDAFYGQGLIAGGGVSRGKGTRLNLYAGAGVGNPFTVGGSQRLWHGTLQAENQTFQRAIGGAMPFVPLARWAIVRTAAPDIGWLDAWNLANPAFRLDNASGPQSPFVDGGSFGGGGGGSWGGPPGVDK